MSSSCLMAHQCRLIGVRTWRTVPSCPSKSFFSSLGCVIIFENAQPVAGDPDEVQKRSQASEFIDKRIVVERSQIILIIEGCVLVTRCNVTKESEENNCPQRAEVGRGSCLQHRSRWGTLASSGGHQETRRVHVPELQPSNAK
ncbi:hypothetical protein C8J57DRAFT_1258554 [Mycena rebaudengoi]|nr:hypothetical protein C8J57DRAFT_1258554 [Mycena rebaudengoi]